MPEADNWAPRHTARWLYEYVQVNGFLPSEIAAVERLRAFVQEHDRPLPEPEHAPITEVEKVRAAYRTDRSVSNDDYCRLIEQAAATDDAHEAQQEVPDH